MTTQSLPLRRGRATALTSPFVSLVAYPTLAGWGLDPGCVDVAPMRGLHPDEPLEPLFAGVLAEWVNRAPVEPEPELLVAPPTSALTLGDLPTSEDN